MAGQKISEMLTATEIDGTEFVPIVKEGVNRKMQVAHLKGDKGDPGKDAPPVVINDTMLLDVYNWTGSTTINTDTFRNFLSLAGIAKVAGGTAGSQVASNFLKLPPVEKPTLVLITVRVTGTVGGSTNATREWRIQIRRPTDAIVSSDAQFKLVGTDITNRDSGMQSYTIGATDLYSTDGVSIGLFNVSGQTITITGVSVRIARITNQV